MGCAQLGLPQPIPVEFSFVFDYMKEDAFSLCCQLPVWFFLLYHYTDRYKNFLVNPQPSLFIL
jgi:hypothetical protein